MCDLIDLDNSTNSPLNTKLASPLIPVPQNTEHGNLSVFNNRDILIVERRESLDNNPFDMVLHEAIEYVRKKEDPFEIVLEKALKKDKTVVQENNDTDNLKVKYTHFSQKLKEGKSLDESFSSTDFVKPIVEVKSLNSSILNHSAMNDTLYETNCDIEENDIKSVVQQKSLLQIQMMGNNIEAIATNIKSVPFKYIRSHSQGDMIQECKQCFRHRSNSAIETLKIDKMSTSEMDSRSSVGFSNTLNKGFLQDQYSDNSVFSTLSNISNITKLNSTSLTHNNISSMISNNTMNRAFLNSCSSDVFCDTKLNGRMNNTMNVVSVSSETSLPITPVQPQIDMSILAQKLNDVKKKLSKSQILQAENTEGDYTSRRILNNTDPYLKNISTKTKIDIDDKLLHINDCSSEITFSKSCSDGFSDSILPETSKANESILNEAKALARTFEKFAQGPESTSDEFIINDPMWTSELLPAYEDEIVDDLIELLSSPNVKKNAVHINKEKNTNEILSCKSNVNSDSNNIKSKSDITRKVEVSSFSPSTVDKRVASTLLLDLKKIVKRENNSEANRLLENLEKVLGIESDSNIELISSYLQTVNDPRKSHESYTTMSEIMKNIEDPEYVNKNDVDDPEIHQIKINENLYHNDKFNNRIKNEVFNDNKNVMIMEGKVQNNLPLVNECAEDSLKKEPCSICTEEKENNVSVSHSTYTNININGKENNETEGNEKVAVELLINLGKVLSGLKNLGEVLQLVSKYKQEKCNEEDDIPSINNERTAVKDKLKTGKKVQSLMSSKSNKRQSLDLVSKTKTSTGKTFRRSMSVTNASPNKNVQSTLVSKDNCKSQLNENSKRFTSDPGLINLASCKKGISISTGDVRKEALAMIDMQQVNIEINNQMEKAPIKLAVKNQLKGKTKSEVVNKKGPMKAVIPLGNMQRKGIVTSPKSPKNIQPSIKIRSSTPNSVEKRTALKKSNSKPMASSTPDTPKRKSVIQLPPLQRYDKLNVSCDISPITVQEEITTDKCKVYLSPNSTSKCPSPRRTTPKKQLKESSIPKYSTSPGIRVRHSSYDMNKSGQNAEFLQVSYKKEENIYKKSPVICKRIGVSPQKSPLKDSNKNINKAKPMNLTLKLRRNDNGSIGCGKENTVA